LSAHEKLEGIVNPSGKALNDADTFVKKKADAYAPACLVFVRN